MTTPWQQTGQMLRSSKRKAMTQHAPMRERCDGCGVEVTRGTTRNVVRAGAEPAGTDGAGRPYYRLEDWQALCSRCRR